MRISVQEQAFDAGAEIALLKSSGVGGINVFVGVVREMNEGDSVSGLFLEHYPGMTEKQIKTIIDEAGARWDLQSATVIHRVGQLHPDDEIVFVGVSSAHRGDTFDACEFIIDFLKTRAAFWKKETFSEGDRWLETRKSDLKTAENWAAKFE
ncbi:MAG: molybdopterin synthase catalytic subunit MoaE [Pseudomonadales bacterium]